MPIPSAQKVMARLGIEPRSPAYMADALTTELLTTPAEISAGSMSELDLRLHGIMAHDLRSEFIL